jgi:flagellar biosynthetic protein FliR
MTINLDRYLLFLLVFARMSGALLFHPFLGRRSVPTIVKVGLALLTAILLTPVLQVKEPVFPSTLAFMLSLGKEMLLGYAVGFIMNLFVSWVLMAGEAVDMELGVGMGRIYDPQSGSNMSLSGSMFQLMLTLCFFVSNGHLTLIRIMSTSCQLFPPGPALFDFEAGNYIALLMADVLVLALKLAMPVFAIELLAEAGMGVLMRIVPQINVFVAGLQVKLAIGLLVIILVLPAVAKLMDASIAQMYEKLQQTLVVMHSGA